MKKNSNSQFKKFKLIRQNFNISEKIATKPVNKTKELFIGIIKNKVALVGIIILTIIIFGAILFPLIWNDSTFIDPTNQNKPMFSKNHFFGTDKQGRDIFGVLWSAIAYSLGLSLFVTLVNLFVGVTLGLLMGYSKKVDQILQFIIKILTNIPTILILILVSVALTPTFWTMVLGLTLTGWIGMSSQVRAQVLKNKQLDYFIASKILGTSWFKQLINFLPVCLPIIITVIVSSIPIAILSESTLGFIGLSVPGAATLGNMINSARLYSLIYPYQIIIPVSALIILTISIQLIGNGVQDVIKKG